MFGLKKSSVPEQSTPPARPTPATLTTKQRGQIGEDAAVLFLQQNGYKIIERNWRPGNALRGEIDAIAWTRDARGQKILCFVEVKARSSNLSQKFSEKMLSEKMLSGNQPALRETAAPQEAVTISKQRQIARLANAYVSIHKMDNIACRFDVVEVHLSRQTAALCTLCVNAFDYQG